MPRDLRLTENRNDKPQPGEMTTRGQQRSPLLNRRFRLMYLLLAGISATAVDGALVAPAGAQSAAAAQPGAGDQLEEVVVTAQRRKENLQDVPVSVEAFSAGQLKDAVIQSDTDLGAITPGLVTAAQFGYFQPHLRGIGVVATSSSVEGQVAVYVDGVYYGAQAGAIFELAGIDHIEVDKGPQGTLFGRNATGGLIQIVTKDPEQDFKGEASITVGNYSTAGTSIYLTGGITDNLAANLSIYFNNQADGFGKDQATGQDINYTQDLAIRHKLKFTPTDDDSIVLAADYEQNHSAPVLIPAPGTTPLGGPPYTGSPWGANGYYQPRNIEKQGGISLTIQHDFGWARLESISAFLQSSLFTQFDGDLVPTFDFALNLEGTDLHNQFTQEFDLRSEPGDAITWTAGLYYYNADARYDPFSLYGGLLAPLTNFTTYSNSHAQSIAPFAQATTEIFDATNLTLGVRYTVEQKRFFESQYGVYGPTAPILFASVSDAPLNTYKPSWKAAIDHKITQDIMVYASYSRGIKSGGFDDQQIQNGNAVSYAPETLDDYEIGAKTSWFDHRLQLDIAGFYYNYSNIQTVSYPAGNELVYNGASAELYGVDIDYRAIPFKNFTVSGGLEIMHDAFTKFPVAQLSTPIPGGGTFLQCFPGAFASGQVIVPACNAAGHRLPIAPDWTFDISPLYVIPLDTMGDLSLAATVSYNDGFYFEPDNRLHQGPYTIANVTVTWTSPDEDYSVQGWVKNLSNVAYTEGQYSQGNGDYAIYAPPRTYGVTFKRNF
jgi:iron complex outermembrane receptor protein